MSSRHISFHFGSAMFPSRSLLTRGAVLLDDVPNHILLEIGTAVLGRFLNI